MGEVRYHSAMGKHGGIAKSVPVLDERVYSYRGNCVLQHDVCDAEIPERFYRADAVFTVMSWRAGYNKFTENTIAKDTDFNQYCEGISSILEALKKPSFVITNKNFIKRIKPQRIEHIRYDRYGSDDICAIWNYEGDTPNNTTELMRFIGDTFDTVLDFCCGYGEIAHYVKHFILSDVNTGCLEYVRKTYLEGE